jgi:hypothetical protein
VTVKKYDTDLAVSDLSIDPQVQRAFLRMDRVEKIKREFNPGALGRIHVSVRKDRSKRVLDGWHRLTAVRQLTDNMGTIPATVFEGLTLAEEAQTFLDLNSGDRPTVVDRYKVSLVAGDPEVVAIDTLLHAYGWQVGPTGASGTVSCVVALQNLYRRSVAEAQEPNLLQLALIVIGKAWGDVSDGAQAHLITGIGRFMGEYKDRVKADRLIELLRDYEGGPRGLTQASKTFATAKKRKLPMAVAELLVDLYNTRLGPRNSLPAWNKRS